MTWTMHLVLLFIVCFQKKIFFTDAFVIRNANDNKKQLLTHSSLRTTKTFSKINRKNFDCIPQYLSTVPKCKTALFVSTDEQQQHYDTDDDDDDDDEELNTILNFLQESRLNSAMSNALFRTNLLMKMSSSMGDKGDESSATMDEDENENYNKINSNAIDTIQNLVRHCQDSVYVSKSTIPNAGQGLFAKQDIPPGTIVSFYPVHAVGVNIDGESFTVTQHEEDQQYFESNTNGDNYLLYLIGDRPIISTDKTILEEVRGQPFINVNPKETKATEGNDNKSSSAWLCHFINDGAIISENTEEGVIEYYESTSNGQNCVLLPFGPSPLCVATSTKAISKGDELFVSYGYSYWLDALVGESEEWTEKTGDIRSFEYDMFNLIMGGIEHIHDVYAEEDEALHTLFDNLD